MKLSKLARIYEFGGEERFFYVIRHTVLNSSFILNEEEYEELKKDLEDGKESQNIINLKKNHILVPDNYNEEKFINFLKDKFNSNKFDLEIIYLIFNSACNLKCKYCYVEGSTKKDFRHQSMNEEIFLDTINSIKKLIKEVKEKNPLMKKLAFIFYGSEPLLSKQLIKRSLKEIDDACKGYKIKPEFNITTNAVLLDDEIIKLFKKYQVNVSVSLDGPKELNDLMRIDNFNKGTYDSIIKGLKKLNKYKVPFGISCTISSHNVNLLKENISFFKKLGAKSIGFNILLNARYFKIPTVPLNKLNDSLIEASDLANSQGIYEDRVQRKFKAFHNSIPRLKDCGGVGNQLVFFPNGDVGVCEAYLCNRKEIIGNVKGICLEDIEKNEVVKKWTKRYPLNMEDCLYCPAVGICGGGCPFNAETRLRNIYELDKPFCVHTNKLLEWLLKDSVSKKTKEEDLFMRDISFMFYNKIF